MPVIPVLLLAWGAGVMFEGGRDSYRYFRSEIPKAASAARGRLAEWRAERTKEAAKAS